MSDPFAPNSSSQLVREAKIGLSLIAVLLLLFVYVAYHRITSQGRYVPQHVRNAPIAESVWPHGPPAEAPAQPTHVPAKIDSSLASAAKTGRTDFQPVSDVRANSSRPESPRKMAIERKPISPKPISPKPLKQSLPPNQPPRVETPIQVVQSSFVEKIPETKLPTVDDQPARQRNVLARDGKQPTDFQRELDSLTQQLQAAKREMETISAGANLAKHSFQLNPQVPLRSNAVAASAAGLETNSNDLIDDTWVNAKNIPPAKTQITANESLKIPQRDANQFAKPPLRLVPQVQHQAEPNGVSGLEPIVDLSAAQRPSGPIAAARAETKAAMRTENHWALESPETSNSQPLNAQVVAPDSQLWRVQPGDSFWTIAQSKYGDGRYFRALFSFNQRRINDFDDLPAGTVLTTPPVDELIRQFPNQCPPPERAAHESSVQHYITHEGDTLFEIARQRMGQASRYLELLKLNAQQLPANVQHLTPLPGGLQLVMPVE